MAGIRRVGAVFALSFLAVAAGTPAAGTVGMEECDTEEGVERLEVTATAYNSVSEQTHPEHSDVTAFGDELEPGMQVVAVSRDLEALGLTRGVEVEIEGLSGTWVVQDRTHSRWTERIDIYMGEDVDAALEWGRRTVAVCWSPDS